MKKSLCSATVLALSWTGHTIAQDSSDAGWYVGVDLGAALGKGDADFSGTSVVTNGAQPTFDMDDTNVVFGGTIGYDFAGPLRTGLELRTRDFDTAGGYLAATGDLSGDFTALKGEVESTTLMWTGFYDFASIGNVQPYAKAGIGAVLNNASASSAGAYYSPVWASTAIENTTVTGIAYPGDSDTEFAWELGGGLAMPLNDRLMVDLGYQYVDAGESETGVNAAGDRIVFDDLAGHKVGKDHRKFPQRHRAVNVRHHLFRAVVFHAHHHPVRAPRA